MSLPFSNTAPRYDEELRNAVFFERGLHATSIWRAVGAAVAVAMLEGRARRRSPAPPDVLRVTARTGEELEARAEINRSGRGNPVSDEELARNFTTTP